MTGASNPNIPLHPVDDTSSDDMGVDSSRLQD